MIAPDLAQSENEDFGLGIEGFSYADLYRPEKLKDLTAAFEEAFRCEDSENFERYRSYRDDLKHSLRPPEESEMLIRAASALSPFIARLFSIEQERAGLMEAIRAHKPIFRFKKEFVQKRVLKYDAKDHLSGPNLQGLGEKTWRTMEALQGQGVGNADPESFCAAAVCQLLDAEKALELNQKRKEPLSDVVRNTLSRLLDHSGNLVGGFLEGEGPLAATLEAVHNQLDTLTQWFHAQLQNPEDAAIKAWSAFHFPKKIDFMHLVENERPSTERPEWMVGPEKHLRRRDGFQLTDRRYSEKQVLDEIDYCVICHPREKDSCRIGIHKKKSLEIEKNPLGIDLNGCPLDERISEMHVLQGEGDAIAALAMIILDNPMVPATGHRICNDCMKGCIYQKQEPVNIPQAETRILTDVLDLPYGFEIYSLLCRWNPLNRKRPYALPYNGKNILVVGMGPAGFTLAHFLLNEGFGVIGIDGLKIEPLPKALVGEASTAPQPVKNISTLYHELDQRVLSGFGGVAEYGITVRWDKNFLDLIHLCLARRNCFQVYGGIRFGGTLTVEDAWTLGFDHIAIAAGAGKPTILDMKNNLIKGIRKASDFLMALQLTGAFKKSSLANLQLRLPALVIGGGLTAIDTATEAMAYYPVQVEKILSQFETLCAHNGEDELLSIFDEEEKEILQEYLRHGRAIRTERARAKESGETPNFIPLLRAWGGVAIVYRREIEDSPAYRLNHEEIIKSLEEGIDYYETLSPIEAIPDRFGAVAGVRFEKQQLKDDDLIGSGDYLELPAKAVLVAAGTTPNVIYEKEYPGTFQMDARKKFFKRYQPTWEGSDALRLEASDDWTTPAVFTSYQKDGKFISYYGDNHPIYAGNVVKAMASAKDGYPDIVRLFENELAALSSKDQAKRDAAFLAFSKTLNETLHASVVDVVRLTPTIIEIIVKAPMQARQFRPGQFYRLQSYESGAKMIEGYSLHTEGIALTGAWVDPEQGLLSLITLEMGVSSRLCAALKPGDPVVVMGPTGAPTEIPTGETVLLAGGGLGNAVLFSIGKAMRASGNKVIYFAGYKKPEDVYKVEEIEAASDLIVWSVDAGAPIQAGRPQDKNFVGNIVEAMVAYAEGKLGDTPLLLQEVDRIIAIGSDRMMNGVKMARHDVLAPYLKPGHLAIGSINSPMQCMMKEVCAQCLQKHVDPITGKEIWPVFSCFNQDQVLDEVDFKNLNDRLKQNSVQEKLTNKTLDLLLKKENIMRV